MDSDPAEIRQQAEARVRRRFTRESTALAAWQADETARASQRQERAAAESLKFEAELVEGKAQALEEVDRRWKQARERLAHKPLRAPAFDLAGGPPARNLASDYDALETRWREGRARIEAEHDKAITACQDVRAAQQRLFQLGHAARAEGHEAARRALAARQQRSFAPAVEREIANADAWPARSFNRRSRADSHER